MRAGGTPGICRLLVLTARLHHGWGFSRAWLLPSGAFVCYLSGSLLKMHLPSVHELVRSRLFCRTRLACLMLFSPSVDRKEGKDKLGTFDYRAGYTRHWTPRS